MLLRASPQVGKTVPYRNAAVLCEQLDGLLLEAAELDAVIEAAQHLCGILERFLLAHLGVRKERHVRAFVVRGGLKRTAGAGAGFLEQQHDVLVRHALRENALFLFGLDLMRELQKRADLIGRVVEQREKVSSLEHNVFPFCIVIFSDYLVIGSRTNGMLMQRGPPRPLESSADGISWTVMPFSLRIRFVT